MTIDQYTCPACGGDIKFTSKDEPYRCDYCGSIFIYQIKNGVRSIKKVEIYSPLMELPMGQSPLTEQNPANTSENSGHYPKSSSVTKELPVSTTLYESPNKASKNTRTTIILILLVVVPLCCLVIGLLGESSPSDTSSSGSRVSVKATNPRTATPTPYLLPLPYSIKSSEGWRFNITKIQVLNSISDIRPEEDHFLIVFMEIINLTGDYDCLKMDEFTAQAGSKKISMDYRNLNPAHNRFSIDYPGGILGQCTKVGKSEKSILVFDVPESEKDWVINFQDESVKIGKLDAIIHPPPTKTPLPSKTHTITATPTITPTPLPTGIVKAGVESSINIRSGPGLNYAVAFQLAGQSSVSILMRNEQSDWYFIQTELGDRGWIRNDLLQTPIDIATLAVSTKVVSTLTPMPTKIPTPRPTIPYSQQPPKGTWCAQNDTRGFCVSGFKYRSYLGYTSAGQNSRFISLGIAVKNISLFDISVNPLDFTMVMEDGRTYEYASETFYYNNALQSVTLSSGNVASGALVFYVPKDVGPRKIICRGGFLESTIEIDLRDKPED